MLKNSLDLGIKLKLAKENLQKTWEEYGETNAEVLQAGKEFDLILNEYLKREIQNLS
jgi:hypothetical protein